MDIHKHLLHSAKINNNCPECFLTEGLEFSFSQTEKETQLYKKASEKIEEVLYCHNCKNVIYPVNWNDDIERVYSYHKKLARSIPHGYRLKSLAYLIIILDVLVLGLIIFLLVRN